MTKGVIVSPPIVNNKNDKNRIIISYIPNILFRFCLFPLAYVLPTIGRIACDIATIILFKPATTRK